MSAQTIAKTPIWYTINAMTKPYLPLPETDSHSERAFFIFLTLVLAGMYISVISVVTLHEPLRFVLFTVLMLVHLALHWSILFLVHRPGWHLPYLLGQGLLIF